ncbi:MAG: response regulator transcription factor [Dehalococcoidia bacterium]|nr:response regulator transcription factor [Dehalococcoidia bacterium]
MEMPKKKVLLIDDNTLLSGMVRHCLTARGHEVRTSHSGVDAVGHLFQEIPDTIVLDLLLPDCDGWFITRLLERLDQKQVPVIIVSVLDPDRREIGDLNVFAYIQKPFDMEELLETVERSLGNGDNSRRNQCFA